MSELKARLLETKNNSFEEMLNYLLKLDSIAGNEKKIQRKMRNLGVIIPTCPIKNVTSNASTGIAGLAS